METTQQLELYAERVRAALGELPAGEADEILGDLRRHLSDLAGELDGEPTMDVLTAKLGSPESYAAELRAAAGYPPAPRTRTPVDSRARASLWLLAVSLPLAFLAGAGIVSPVSFLLLFPVALVFVGLAAAIAAGGGREQPAFLALPEVQWLRAKGIGLRDGGFASAAAFLPKLQMSWWLARAGLAAMAVGATLLRGSSYADNPLWLLVLPGIPFAVVSVWLGLHARENRLLWWCTVPGNAMAIGVLVVTLLIPTHRDDSVSTTVPSSGVYHDGSYVTNMFAFDPAGKPIPTFYLYDDQGQPVEMQGESCSDEGGSRDNRFPKTRARWFDGRCTEQSGVPFTVAVPSPGQSSSAVPSTPVTPTPTPTPTPTR